MNRIDTLIKTWHDTTKAIDNGVYSHGRGILRDADGHIKLKHDIFHTMGIEDIKKKLEENLFYIGRFGFEYNHIKEYLEKAKDIIPYDTAKKAIAVLKDYESFLSMVLGKVPLTKAGYISDYLCEKLHKQENNELYQKTLPKSQKKRLDVVRKED